MSRRRQKGSFFLENPVDFLLFSQPSTRWAFAMASARLPLDPPDGPSANAPLGTTHAPPDSTQPSPEPPPATMNLEADTQPQPVSQQELNAWRRGFTPQAEIWNGRLAMVGLSVGLTVLIVARLAHHS